jgi:hypothetical protein
MIPISESDLAAAQARADAATEWKPVIYEQYRKLCLDEYRDRQGHVAELRLHPKWLYRLSNEVIDLPEIKYGSMYDPDAEGSWLRLVDPASRARTRVVADASVDYARAIIEWPTWRAGVKVTESTTQGLTQPLALTDSRSLERSQADVPNLIAEVRRLRGEIERLKAARDAAKEVARMLRYLGSYDAEMLDLLDRKGAELRAALGVP